MTDLSILIKSARRPWALARLLDSLEKYLKSREALNVIVVDDRTDQEFLDYLAARHPKVLFKSVGGKLSSKGKPESLPYVKSWHDTVSQMDTEFVMILEDDQWLISDIEISEYIESMLSFNSSLIFLSKSPEELIGCKTESVEGRQLSAYMPEILSRVISEDSKHDLLLARFLSMHGVLGRKFVAGATILSPRLVKESWASLAMVNPMCGVIYRREDWLENWKGDFKNINENRMISRAVSRLMASPSIGKHFLVPHTSQVKTTFVSSISWDLGTGVDWEACNLAFSHSWIRGDLAFPEGSQDWDAQALASIVRRSLGVEAQKKYLQWVQKFWAMHHPHTDA